jgi:Phosphatase
VSSGDALRDHLLASRLSGWVATPRSNSVDHFRRLADGDPYYFLGLELGDRWPYDKVVTLMEERCGRPPTPWEDEGPDWIDPDLTIAALDRFAAVLGRGRQVLFATGHPHGLLGVHLALSRAVVAAGGTLVSVPGGLGQEGIRVDQLEGVAMAHAGGSLRHSHAGRWMDLVLDALPSAPDLVVADHGWTGAAAQRGIEAIGFADCNDPGLFCGESEGTVAVAVPIDDGLAFPLYEPVIDRILTRAFE